MSHSRPRSKTIEILRERDGPKCWICLHEFDFHLFVPHPRAPTLDHVVERKHGGRNELKNLRLACSECNNLRSNGKDSAAIRVSLRPSDAVGRARLGYARRKRPNLIGALYAAEQRKLYPNHHVLFCDTCGDAIWDAYSRRLVYGYAGAVYVHESCRNNRVVRHAYLAARYCHACGTPIQERSDLRTISISDDLAYFHAPCLASVVERVKGFDGVAHGNH